MIVAINLIGLKASPPVRVRVMPVNMGKRKKIRIAMGTGKRSMAISIAML
jgi:hypothetical protein